jgi:NAD+ synthase (glutamine-hydrolysing)
MREEEKIYQALVLSVRDYINKNAIPGAIIGVSGGIDSALTLAIAVDAIGKERVQAVIMPSRYTSTLSMEEAQTISHHLGVKTDIIAIDNSYQSFLQSLAPIFADKKLDITEENIQARTRATILMALANQSGRVVLTTGNRSEMAVGYCTLYGDMAGGFAVIKDVYKLMVYRLAHYRNSLSQVIPPRTIERAPTAELAYNQKDEDSLPPYPILDKILAAYLDESKSKEEIIQLGFKTETVEKVLKLIKQSEHKRRQAAIGPRINPKSFGRDWRYPLTNGFTD